MKTGLAEDVTEAADRGAMTLSRRDKMLALAGTLAALLMAGLDQTIVATAGPDDPSAPCRSRHRFTRG